MLRILQLKCEGAILFGCLRVIGKSASIAHLKIAPPHPDPIGRIKTPTQLQKTQKMQQLSNDVSTVSVAAAWKRHPLHSRVIQGTVDALPPLELCSIYLMCNILRHIETVAMSVRSHSTFPHSNFAVSIFFSVFWTYSGLFWLPN